MDWDDLRFFLAVARTGSLTGAAALLASSSATVARRIRAFEQAMGTACFARLPNGYALTKAGSALFDDAVRVEAAMAQVAGRHGGSDAEPAGWVRLAAPAEFAEYLLVPRLPALLDQNPGLRLELLTGVEVLDVNRNEVDVAFRAVRPQSGQYARVKRLADFPFSLYGTPGFIERHCTAGPLPNGLPLISRPDAYDRLATQQWERRTLPNASVVLKVTTLRQALAACRLGLGATVLPDFIGELELDLMPFRPDLTFHVPKWLVFHGGLAETARVRAVVDWLADAFATYVPPNR